MCDDRVIDVAPFLAGWLLGWFMLWSTRPLPPLRGRRSAVSIIIPARDEVDALPDLLAALTPQLGPGDELLVVDDHSTDATADAARRGGAAVARPPEPADGWLGKPNACWHGARATHNDVLVFIDADVTPGSTLIDGLRAALAGSPDAVVSVQPWHEPGRPSEQLSMLFNVAALMGTGRFSLFGRVASPPLAFGPVLAIHRETYDRVGGHAEPTVRVAHTEDIALARTVGRSEIYTGRTTASFRMYPGGFPDLIRGWTRSIATGATSTPMWAGVATAGWIWALAAAPFIAWWAYLVSAVQCFVLGRRAGRFTWWIALIYPIALAVFLIIVMRSLWRFIRRRNVQWKGRSVSSR